MERGPSTPATPVAKGLGTFLPQLGLLRVDSELKHKVDDLLKKVYGELEEASRLIKAETDKETADVPPTPPEADPFATEVDEEQMEVDAEAQKQLDETVEGILGEGATEEAKRKAREAIEASAKRPRISRG